MQSDPAEDLAEFIIGLDHVAFAVRDLATGAQLFRHLGGTFLQGADSPWNGFRWVQFTMPGGAVIELLAPVAADSFLHAFLDRRGEGVHHLTFKVTDLEAAVARAGELGYDVLGHQRVHAAWAEAFLHPAQANGTVIQLAQSDYGGPAGSTDWDAVMRGAVIDGP